MSEFRRNWENGVEPGLDTPAAETHHFKFVIIGGGNSAGYAARTFVESMGSSNPLGLNQSDIKSSVIRDESPSAAAGASEQLLAIISAEPVPPYERPALSKAYLNPPGSKVQLRLPNFNTCVGSKQGNQSEGWYEENNVKLFLNHQAFDIDRASQTIRCDRREDRKVIAITYDKLIIATGARPLFTDMFDKTEILENIFVLRNEIDAAGIVKGLEQNEGKKLIIIGGGYIGLECAAAFAGWNIEVTVIYPEDHVLQRVFTSDIAHWYESHLEKKGVKLLKGTKVLKFQGTDGKVTKADLDNGTAIDCDMVLIGIGALLNIDLDLAELGLELGNKYVKGILVDSAMQSSDANIYAIGDVAAVPHKRGHKRFEHVDHCRKTAHVAVSNMLIQAHNYVVDKYGASDATKFKQQVVHTYLPYYYSRLFEYTDTPVIFNYYGSSGEGEEGVKVVQFGDCKSPAVTPIGSFWIDRNNKIIGGLLCCAPTEAFAELKEIVVNNRKIPSLDEAGATKLFSKLGL